MFLGVSWQYEQAVEEKDITRRLIAAEQYFVRAKRILHRAAWSKIGARRSGIDLR